MDSKVVIIYGEDDLNRNIEAGKSEFLGNILTEDLHIACLLKYIDNKYSNIPPFNQLNDRHSPETVCYYINKLLGHIVFLNTTKNIEKYGKTGLFLLPSKITDAHKDTLYEFLQSINDYSVIIAYDMYVDEGILSGKEMRAINHQTPLELFDSYFEKTKNKQI